MNILQLEQERAKLKEKLTAQYSAQARLLFLFSFFDKVLATEDKNIIDAFLPEFIPEYIFCLKNFSVFGLKPRMHESIIQQVEQIQKSGHISGFEDFSGILTGLKDELEKLQRVLSGEHIEKTESKAYFPLLEEEAIKETEITIGILESVTIKIHPAKKENKFIIVPSEKEIEEKISEQVKLSWLNAIIIAKKYIKRIHPYHEVIISFDKKAGFCKGNSLGTALTLAFIEEIFKTYNSPVSIKVGDGIAFTGGMDEQGKITNTSEEIIKHKTELIFFSEVSLFIVPKKEEDAAIEKLNELRKEFPQRDLKIIGIEDINELLDRRTIVEIKKQPVIVRSGKFVKKNWVSAVVAIFLTMILSFIFVLDFDDNPALMKSEESTLYIKNKNGKILWTKKVGAEISSFTVGSEHSLYSRIYDVNSDNENEVLISNEIPTFESENFNGLSLKCYNKAGFLLWEYSFQDSVKSDRENLEPYYAIMIIDTVDVYGQKNILLFSTNTSSFSSAIYRLDAKTGRRLPGTLWCSGHTYNAIIKDLNEDGKKDVLAIGVDNGFEEQVVFAFQIDSLTKVRPSTVDYTINDLPFADLISYIRIPKTDFTNYINLRIPGIGVNSLYDDFDEKVYRFAICINYEPEGGRVWMKLGYSLIDFDIVIDNQFRVLRDSLVVKGQLDLPLTDTNEYKEIIESNILYWKFGRWLKRKELDK